MAQFNQQTFDEIAQIFHRIYDLKKRVVRSFFKHLLLNNFATAIFFLTLMTYRQLL